MIDNNKRTMSYAGLILVILTWGVSPIITSQFMLNYYSAAVFSASCATITFIFLLCFSAKKLKTINKKYFLIAVPTGLFYACASVMQKIGLQYTTPTRCAFLENLSCITVPVLLFLFTRKKPTFAKIASSLLCLFGAFILSSANISQGNSFIGVGEILCTLAGLFYGVNIAATGTYAKDLYSPMYLMIQMGIEAVVASTTAIVLNNVLIDGAPIEAAKFTFDFFPLLALIADTLFITALCWLIRTNSLKHINATVVAIIMPFSAVVTGIISVLMGVDELSYQLVFGGLLGLIAIIWSSLDDVKTDKNQTKPTSDNRNNK